MKKSRIIKIFVVTVLLVSIQVTVLAATIGVVNSDTVRVRKKASANNDESPIIELVSIGDKITIIGEDGDWYKVKVNGKEGYIRKDLLTVEGEDSTTENPNTTPNEQPSDKPTNAEVPAENNGQLTNNGDTAISVLKATGGVYAGKKLQLSEETKIKILPSVNSRNMVELAANTEVTVLEVINKWCRVEAEGACGWVRIDQ